MASEKIHWILAFAPVLSIALVVLLLIRRRLAWRDHADIARSLGEARRRGSHKARLQHPAIDLSQCIGCGACVRACPEQGVLSLLHGQAVIVHGSRCVGHGLCAAACPTGAIALTLGDLSDRRDLPAVDDQFEAVGVPGLFIAGELGGFALVRTAITQGAAVACAVAHRVKAHHHADDDQTLDLLIVGAGPGGLACALQAKAHGLRALTIDQHTALGGSVAAYPRRKLVMTQPVELPLHGRLPRLSYQKEELIELWNDVAAKHDLPIQLGVALRKIHHNGQSLFEAQTTRGVIRARHVCLAMGRRGSPRKLNVPGEQLPKVAYSLLDAESYRGRRILVIGGGDSAVEAALGLAEQPGNQVTLSYRKSAFFRLKARNEKRLDEAQRARRLRVMLDSEVSAIEPARVSLRVGVNGQATDQTLDNDEVFVFAGGVAPFGLLEEAGVSFDPADRPAPSTTLDRGTSLLASLSAVGVCAAAMLAWALWHRHYYDMPPTLRPDSQLHPMLRPTGGVGLMFGLTACVLFVWNLSYLLRRSRAIGRFLPGSLKLWMTTHVFTGLGALLCVLMHAGFSLRDTVGGHALIALTIVVITGVIGRYLYAFVPRAANGHEIDLEHLRAEMAALSGQWDRAGRGFGTVVRDQIEHLLTIGRWRTSLAARLMTLLVTHIRLSRGLSRLRAHGRRMGLPQDQVNQILSLARRAHRLSLLVTHYEEIRTALASWRYFHRWLALLMVLLAAIHIITAIRFASIDWSVLRMWIGGGA